MPTTNLDTRTRKSGLFLFFLTWNKTPCHCKYVLRMKTEAVYPEKDPYLALPKLLLEIITVQRWTLTHFPHDVQVYPNLLTPSSIVFEAECTFSGVLLVLLLPCSWLSHSHTIFPLLCWQSGCFLAVHYMDHFHLLCPQVFRDVAPSPSSWWFSSSSGCWQWIWKLMV